MYWSIRHYVLGRFQQNMHNDWKKIKFKKEKSRQVYKFTEYRRQYELKRRSACTGLRFEI
jgi:hypothetical protein